MTHSVSTGLRHGFSRALLVVAAIGLIAFPGPADAHPRSLGEVVWLWHSIPMKGHIK